MLNRIWDDYVKFKLHSNY